MPRSLRAEHLELAGEDLVVFSFRLPTSSKMGAHGALTATELDVLRLLLAGRSNREIAKVRKRSVGTIAKQVDAIYRRLGVHSRRELAVLANAVW
jgi:DNA-binding NarL/FixJ family response regulator